MAEPLTQDWLDAQRAAAAELPEHPGASARIEYRVTGTPEGEVVLHTVLEDGRLVTNAIGEDPDADFTMLLPLDTYVAVLDGSLDPNVGFMQGRIKVTGNIGRMLSVLPITGSPGWRASIEAASAA